MPNDVIKNKGQLLKKNLDFLGHDMKLLGEIVTTHEGARRRVLGFIYRVITVMGLVIGFGFTALPKVCNLTFFLIGQGILLMAIIFTLVWIKKNFLDEIKNYHKWIFDLRRIIDKRMQVDPNHEATAIESKMEEIKKDSLNFAKDMRSSEESERWWQKIFGTGYIYFVLIIFVLGVFMVLFSLWSNSLCLSLRT